MKKITKEEIKRFKGKLIKDTSIETLRGLAAPYIGDGSDAAIDKFKDSIVFKQFCLKRTGADALNNKEKFFIDEILEGIFRKESDESIIDKIDMLLTAATIKPDQETIESDPVTIDVDVVAEETPSESVEGGLITPPKPIVAMGMFGEMADEATEYLKKNKERIKKLIQTCIAIKEQGGDDEELGDELIKFAQSQKDINFIIPWMCTYDAPEVRDWIDSILFQSDFQSDQPEEESEEIDDVEKDTTSTVESIIKRHLKTSLSDATLS